MSKHSALEELAGEADRWMSTLENLVFLCDPDRSSGSESEDEAAGVINTALIQRVAELCQLAASTMRLKGAKLDCPELRVATAECFGAAGDHLAATLLRIDAAATAGERVSSGKAGLAEAAKQLKLAGTHIADVR